MDGEIVFGPVAVIVGQNIGETIGALLVETHNTTVETGMQDGQAETFLAVGLHIPHMITAPMEVVAPDIHLGLAADGDAVHIGAEHLATIDQQPRVADTVMVIGGFTIVVGPKGKAYPAPCCKLATERPNGVLLLDVGLAEAEGLLGKPSVENSLAIHGNGHKGMGLRGYGIGNEMGQAGQRVAHYPRMGIVKLEVQVGSRGIAGIAANGYQFARLDGKLARGKAHLQGVAPSGALELLLIDVGKAFQMTIHAGQSVGVCHIDGVAKAVLVDGKMADITFGHRVYLLALLVARLDIDASMKVPGTRLTEVAGEHNLVVHGGNIFYIRIADRLGITAATCQQ